jgi:hypothetical protein
MPELSGTYWRINSANHHPIGLGGLQCARVKLDVSRLNMPADVGPPNPPIVDGFAIHNIHWLKETGLITSGIGDGVTEIPSSDSGVSWISQGPSLATLQIDDSGRYYLQFDGDAIYTLTPPSNSSTWSCCIAYKMDDDTYSSDRRLVSYTGTSSPNVLIGPYRNNSGFYKGQFILNTNLAYLWSGSDTDPLEYNYDTCIQNGPSEYIFCYNSGTLVSSTNSNSFSLNQGSVNWSLGGGFSPTQYYQGRFYGSFFATTNWDVYQREAVENYINSPTPGV